MKKLIGAVAIAAVLATSAFAEISIGAWVRQLWSPVAYNGGDVLTGIQNSWGDSRTAGVNLNWVGDDEKAGASFGFVSSYWWDSYKLEWDEKKLKAFEDGDDDVGISDLVELTGNSPIALDGNNLIWVKPWNFLKISLGHWDNAGGTDIATVNTASWDWIRPKNMWTEHLYFENENTGALFQITPMEDLYIAVGLPFANPDQAYHMFEAIAVDVAYTVPDIVKIMAGWRGGRNGSGRDSFSNPAYKSGSDFVNIGEVDVYANLIAVENLQLEAGVRINILDEDKVADGTSKALVGVKAGYNITDRFSVKADFATLILKELDPGFQFGVGVGVGITDSLSLDADFRGILPCNDIDPTFSFLVGLNYACSTNASVGIGFEGKTNGGDIITPTWSHDYKNGDNFGFAVPIKVEVSF